MENEYPYFVYGTLKRGYNNDHILSNSKSTYRLTNGYDEQWTTKKKFYLWGGSFPFVCPPEVMPPEVAVSHTPRRVKGEVYVDVDIEAQVAMDYLESEGQFYHRRLVNIKGVGPCWTYLILSPRYTTGANLSTYINSEGDYEWQR